MVFDIKWHDINKEMPGAELDVKNYCFQHFLLRYFWNCDPNYAYYDKGILSHGRFRLLIDYDVDEYKNRDEMHNDLKITHWAFIYHPCDHD